jgi:hypothetical protein
MLQPKAIETSAAALMLAVQVATNRTDAHRLRSEAEELRSLLATKDQRAASLEKIASDAETKLRSILDSVEVASGSTSVAQLEPFAISPRQAAKLEDCGLTLMYERLKRGEYEAVKDGTRTKIVLESIKRRRATHLLPHAEHKLPIPTRWRLPSQR